MKIKVKIAAMAIFISAIMLANTMLPAAPMTVKVKAGTYGDFITDNEAGNVIGDNAVGTIIDKGSDALIVPATIGAGPQLAGGGGIMVTHQVPNPAAKWYNGPAVNSLGKIIKVGGFFIGTYDTLKDCNKMWNYHSPESYTDTEAAIDHSLYVADVGMGLWAVGKGALIFGGTIVAGGTVGAGLVAAAGATAGIYAASRFGIQITRAMYNAGYFGKIGDGIYYGWQGFKGGVVKVGGYAYDGLKSFGGGLIYTKDLVKGGFKWLMGGLTGAATGSITGDFAYDGIEGINDEIPDPSTGIGVYKPNIYIYDDYDMDVKVSLANEEMITASEPLYEKNTGWTAKVRNGSINGTGDYLFYEAVVPDRGFQKDKGWIVRAESLEKDMQKILELYDFNDKEKADFIDYWVPALSGRGDFIFYPQETAVVDAIMPLVADPLSENVYRIWFYIEACPASAKVAQPEAVEVIKTHANALIEWGGVYSGQ